MSSARVVRCWVKSRNERNPYLPVSYTHLPVKEKEESLPENNNDKILRLHKQGMSSVDIAKELGLGVGEVKLRCV